MSNIEKEIILSFDEETWEEIKKYAEENDFDLIPAIHDLIFRSLN